MKQLLGILIWLMSVGVLSAQEHTFEFDVETVSGEDIRVAYDHLSPGWPASPDQIRLAVVLAEDREFFNQFPIHSTMTTHLSRLLLVDQNPVFQGQTARLKMALFLTNVLSHDEILTWYLQAIYMGQGCYGVTNASLAYFGVSPDELSLEKVAYLAALPKAPLLFHPDGERDRVIARRNWILGEMQKSREMSDTELAQFQAMPLGVSDPLGRCDGN